MLLGILPELVYCFIGLFIYYLCGFLYVLLVKICCCCELKRNNTYVYNNKIKHTYNKCIVFTQHSNTLSVVIFLLLLLILRLLHLEKNQKKQNKRRKTDRELPESRCLASLTRPSPRLRAGGPKPARQRAPGLALTGVLAPAGRRGGGEVGLVGSAGSFSGGYYPWWWYP